MQYRKAIVTGGAGFIGSHITERLLAEGIEVTVIDDLSIGSEKNIPAGARFIEGNILDYSLMRRVVKDADVVFHQAAKVSIRASFDQCFEDAEVNVMGTLNTLRACIGSTVRKFVLASSMAVYADSHEKIAVNEDYTVDPISPYGVAKAACERYAFLMCREYGIDCLALRYFNTFGPRQTFTPYVGVITIFIKRLNQGESPVIFGDGKQLRDFVYVGDIANANILAMKSNLTGEIINIGSGTATNVTEVADLLIKRINPAIEAEYDDERPGELKISFADISKARKMLGYIPAGRLADRIDEVIEYLQS